MEGHMSLEPRPTEASYKQPMRVNSSAGSSQASTASSVVVPSSLDADSGEAESEMTALSRAATLLIDTPVDALEDTTRPASTVRGLKYVHGIVQGQRVYIVTNLLRGESRTLFQPQMVWTIGRHRGAALPLQDRSLSRRHAVILYAQNVGFQLVDLNSMNGSFINGVRIQHRQLLEDGDCIRMGSTEFIFFSSRASYSIEAIHPEVLARFSASKARSDQFLDYSALEEPEILFKTTRE